MHLTAGDMLRTMTFEGDNWQSTLHAALQSVAWALRSTIHSTLGYSPGQLVFNRDMIMQNKIFVDWAKINDAKQRASIMANKRENSVRLQHNYKKGNYVLLFSDRIDTSRKINSPTEGPYEILKVYSNGTIRIQRKNYTETVSIRRVKPFTPPDSNNK